MVSQLSEQKQIEQRKAIVTMKQHLSTYRMQIFLSSAKLVLHKSRTNILVICVRVHVSVSVCYVKTYQFGENV